MNFMTQVKNLTNSQKIANGLDLIHILSTLPKLSACKISNTTYKNAQQKSFNVINSKDEVVLYISIDNLFYIGTPKSAKANAYCKCRLSSLPRSTVTQICINGTHGHCIRASNPVISNYLTFIENYC